MTILISLSLILGQGWACCTHEYSLSVSHGDKELNRLVSHESQVLTLRAGHLPSGPWLFLSLEQWGLAGVSRVPLDHRLPQLQVPGGAGREQTLRGKGTMVSFLFAVICDSSSNWTTAASAAVTVALSLP